MLKPDIVQACQCAFQSIINSFQESKDAADSLSVLDLQSFSSEFDRLCSDINVHFFACSNVIVKLV
jgi:hypothetical protein